jgi:hypothetical protein
MRGKTVTVTGMIIDIKTALPDTYKQSNSKSASFLYYVNGEKYISENRIQVPMTAEIGNKKSIKVIIDQPQKIYTKSFTKFAIVLFLAILCAFIGFAFKNR